MRINRCTIHCSDTPNLVEYPAAKIRDIHIKQRGWSDIGYHFVIQPNGTVEQGRNLDQIGAHVEGHNMGNAGICLVGRDQFSVYQFKALRDLLDKIVIEEEMLPWEIYCHNDFTNGKTCPNMQIRRILAWYFSESTTSIRQYIVLKDRPFL